MYGLSISEQAQQGLVTRLSSDALFDGTIANNGQPIEVIQELKGDIANMISVSLGKIGVSVVVLTPTFQLFDNFLYTTGGWLMQQINVFEDPIFNGTPSGTGIRAIAICERIVELMQMWESGLPAQAGIPSRWQCEQRPWTYVANTSNPQQYIVNLQLNTILPQPDP
jgi:hypothetical protein